MDKQINEQKIGKPLPYWVNKKRPSVEIIDGKYCRLEHVETIKHFEDLYQVYGPSSNPMNWTYLPFDQFKDEDDFRAHLEMMSQSVDPFHFAIVDIESGKALGTIALMRIDSTHGVIEVGYVIYSDELKKTRIATEAQFLLAHYVFNDLGYRRYEWKCDALNHPSINAALRLGFTFEGIFRQAMVYKGRNRDTAWLSIIDKEWPSKRARLIKWLSEENFDQEGNQKISLNEVLKSTID